ncbi:MAG: hypothetical protein AAFZ15_01430 [Bacteroidota bacterium]
MYRYFLAFLFLIFSFSVNNLNAQGFPEAWAGIWKGEMTNHNVKGKQSQFPMELHILPTDSAHVWTWRLVYHPNDRPKDARNYQLVLKDKAAGHYVIDEKNGILLDAYYIDERLISNFSIGNNEIMSVQYLKKKKLITEMVATTVNPLNITGGTSEEVPDVSSYLIDGFFRGELKKSKK